MNGAECKALNIPWPLGECISGSGDFVPHPGEERFDFPCSQTWRDFYDETPAPQDVTERIAVEAPPPDRKYQSLRAQIMQLRKEVKQQPVHSGGVDV